MDNGIFSEDGEGEVIDVGAESAEGPQAGPGPQAAPQPGLQPVLRAEWDAQGRCWVALFQGQKQLEKWRPPTKEEWDELRKRGVLTRPSPVAPPIGQAAPAAQPSVMDTLRVNAVPFALGAGALLLAVKFAPQLFTGFLGTPRKTPAIDENRLDEINAALDTIDPAVQHDDSEPESDED